MIEIAGTAAATPARRPRRSAIAAEGVVRTPKHLYYFNGEGPWPGVTSVVKVLDSPALTRWKLNAVAELAIAKAEQLVDDRENGRAEAAVKYLTAENTAARDRGKRIHETLEHILRRATNVPVDPRDEAEIAGARAWLNSRSIRPIFVEAFLINRTLGYGGTCDLIAEIDGVTWLLDWKSGSSVALADGTVYEDIRLQLVAYARAEFMAQVGDATPYQIPTIDRFGVLHVTPSGTRLYEASISEADWNAFRACLYVHGWRKGKAA